MYQSINPTTQENLLTINYLSDTDLFEKLKLSQHTFKNWKRTDIGHRRDMMLALQKKLLEQKESCANIITLEMGKIISEARAELEKSAGACQYYAENASIFLASKKIASPHVESYIFYEPLGSIYAIMPWNFPFWQVFRCVVPAIMAGNTVVLKHAENVPQAAVLIEELFLEAGFPEGVFQNLFISHQQSEEVVKHTAIKGISLTGSERAGSMVAAQASAQIKRSVLELGGSDPFIVLEDADINLAAETGIKARMQNAGQSCIAAKRFILHKNIAEQFLEIFIQKAEAIKLGNPFLEETMMGPLARVDLLETLESQINTSIAKGAKILYGAKRMDGPGNFYLPTVLINIPEHSPAYQEELFGPCASVFTVANDKEAIYLANHTKFGLGASLWTHNKEKAFAFAQEIESGSVFLNAMVKSDTTLPFGGTKNSGYGRELSEAGIHEFVNLKTICWD